MMGRHHAGLSLMSGVAATTSGLLVNVGGLDLGVINEMVRSWAVPDTPDGFLSWAMFIGWIVVATGCLIVGGYLPDIDSKSSTLGRYVHVPLRHRGWTHSNWFVLAIFALSLFDPTHLSPWLMLGVISHDLSDELSQAGRVHWYPFTSYKVITRSNHEIVVKPRWRGFYQTSSSSSSEKWVYRTLMAVLAVTAVIETWLCSTS